LRSQDFTLSRIVEQYEQIYVAAIAKYKKII
jgi:hypothetical protein